MLTVESNRQGELTLSLSLFLNFSPTFFSSLSHTLEFFQFRVRSASRHSFPTRCKILTTFTYLSWWIKRIKDGWQVNLSWGRISFFWLFFTCCSFVYSSVFLPASADVPLLTYITLGVVEPRRKNSLEQSVDFVGFGKKSPNNLSLEWNPGPGDSSAISGHSHLISFSMGFEPFWKQVETDQKLGSWNMY